MPVVGGTGVWTSPPLRSSMGSRDALNPVCRSAKARAPRQKSALIRSARQAAADYRLGQRKDPINVALDRRLRRRGVPGRRDGREL
jgi:hypothetical protein